MFGYDSDSTYAGGFVLSVGKATQGTYQYLIGLPNGHLSWGNNYPGNSLSDAAIVSKNIATDGYIKYASGLILQWGRVNVANKTNTVITFPISFTGVKYQCVATYGDSLNAPRYLSLNGTQQFTNLYLNSAGSSNAWVEWVAVGL